MSPLPRGKGGREYASQLRATTRAASGTARARCNLMRTLLLASCLVLAAACSSNLPGDDSVGDDSSSADADPNTGDRLTVVTPPITLAPSEEVTKCYHFLMPNTGEVGVKRWASTMTPGSHHMILYLGTEASQPPGTIDDCGNVGGFNSVWTYAAQNPVAESRMPEGVGMTVAAMQPGVIQMHYLNASDGPLDAHVELTADLYAAGASFQKAQPYITFNTNISIPPMSNGSAGGTCAIPAGAQFFAMSTHAHKQATHTEVKDGTAMVFESDNWDDPGSASWQTAPFYTFGSGNLTYRCDYYNPTNRTITVGESAATDEMCMAVGYYFPANRPSFCLNSAVLQ